ncbi:uncharacterized protein [Arachis hypogaea]|uniref:uncharacterized protein isoform X4 n=1 Tax=Arachis hypogaea TaxID=3818 RepID=UPI003B22708C
MSLLWWELECLDFPMPCLNLDGVFNQEDFNQLCSAIANLLDCTSWSGAGPGLMDDVTQGAHQELKANKEELRVEKLKDKEEVEDLTHEMAELRWQEWTFGGWMEVVKA